MHDTAHGRRISAGGDLERWAIAFPDGRAEEIETVDGGDTVVVCFTGRGTNPGPRATPAGEMAATGREARVRFCDVIEFENGKIARGRSYFDMATMMRQLGLTPEPAAAGAPA